MGRYGPGPGAYGLPSLTGYQNHDITKYRNPEYSFGIKGGFGGRYGGPGPQYNTSGLTRFGVPGDPKYTCAPRLTGPSGTRTPGPGAHSPENCPRMKEQRPPQWTMAPQTLPASMKSKSPGPAAYALPSALGPDVPDKPSYGAYTMKDRTNFKEASRSPGPAQYGPPTLDNYKTRNPLYTCAPRTNPPTGGNKSPGPAAYMLGRVGPPRPEYSFGVRHSENSPPLISPDDNYPCA